jgi:hypothetical protein
MDTLELKGELDAALVAEVNRLRALVAAKDEALRFIATQEHERYTDRVISIPIDGFWRGVAQAALDKE